MPFGGRPVEFSVSTWAQLVAAYALASDNDIIKVTASPITATSDLAIQKSLTFNLGGSLTQSVWTLGDHTISVGSTTSTGAQRLTTFNGPFTLSSTATGPIWGTGTANAVLEVSNTGTDPMTCVLNSVTIDANNLGDRCARAYGLTGKGLATLVGNNCVFQNSLDDNVGGTCDSAATTTNAHTVLNSCTCSVATYGNNLGAHFYGSIETTNCTLTGAKLYVGAPVSHATISISGGTVYWGDTPANGQGALPSTGSAVYALGAFSVDTGGVLTCTNVGITNAGTATSSPRLLGVVSASTGCSVAFVGCTITSSKNGGLFVCQAPGTLTLQDTTVAHTGDPRFYIQTGWTGTQYSTGSYYGVTGNGDYVITRSKLDYSGCVDRSGTIALPILGPTGNIYAEGLVLLRSPYSSTSGQHGFVGFTGVNTTNSYFRCCEFVGRLGAGAAASDAFNFTTANTGVKVEGTIVRHWNNGFNLNASGDYKGVGYNVFKGMVNKNVAGGTTKASDLPASNASNTSATTTFFNETAGSLDVRPSDQSDAEQAWSGIAQSTEDLALFDAYKLERWPITIGVVGGGTVSRSPLATDRFTSPNDAGAYTKEGQSIVLTATPNAGYVFSSWLGSITGSSNPATLSVTSADFAVTATFVSATGSVGIASGNSQVGNLVSRRARAMGSSISPTGSFLMDAATFYDFTFATPVSHVLLQLSPTTMGGRTCYVALNRSTTPNDNLSDWDFIVSGDAAPPRLQVDVQLITKVSLYFTGVTPVVRTSDFTLQGW